MIDYILNQNNEQYEKIRKLSSFECYEKEASVLIA